MNEIPQQRRSAAHCDHRQARARGLWLGIAAVTAGLLSPLSAQIILNPSFESQTPTGGANYSNIATDWTAINGATNSGTFAPGIALTGPAPSAGSQWGFANSGGSLRQVSTGIFATNQLYTFSVAIGYRGDQAGTATGTITLGYYDGGTFTALSAQTATVSAGTYSLVTGSYQTGGAELGLPIAVQLTNSASNQVLFDQAQLSFTASPIPEPASCAFMLGIAAVVIVSWRRRVRTRRGAASADD